MNKMVYWIWLSLACTPDSATFPKLIEKFGDAEDIYNADTKSIMSCIGAKASDRANLEDKNLDRAKGIFEFCEKHNVGILAYPSEKYPASLRSIKTPPVLLYYRGVLPDFNRDFFVASVGTRSISDYGRKSAFKICYDLATAGAIIVSGMALGNDGVSHAGALSAGKPTVAVIGSGIDVCYPKNHLTLAREIVKNGCVLTEFAPGTPPDKYNFPKRNRIISGLSSATLVIEGKERSGALITARAAMEQGRVVYALPGNVGSENSQLTSLLLKNGAKALTCAEDVLSDFSERYSGLINPFELKVKPQVDMMAALSRLGVEATCPSDDIFKPTRSYKRSANEEKASVNNEIAEVSPPPSVASFDAKSISVYKRIPPSEIVDIESLVNEDLNLRELMKCILKLEMSSFIEVLPGERVRRKSK